MKIQHTPAPYPSTILSLTPTEEFRYHSTRVQAITIAPGSRTPYTLSGESGITGKLRTHTLPQLPVQAPALVRSVATAELARYAAPEARRTPQHPDARAVQIPGVHTAAKTTFSAAPAQHLADPSGPAPTPAQADSIRNSAQRTAPTVPAQKQHLAALPSFGPGSLQGKARNAGKHRA